MNLQKWTRPQSYIGAAWDGFYVFISKNRDSSLLEQSNYSVALERLRPLSKAFDFDEEQGVQSVRENHFLCGWIEWIAIHHTNTEALEEANRIIERLESHPALNEDHLSNLEHNAYLEAWDSYGHREFIRELERAELIEESACDDCAKDATLEAFELLISSGEYHSDGSPNIGIAIQNAKRGGLNDEVCQILNLETDNEEA